MKSPRNRDVVATVLALSLGLAIVAGLAPGLARGGQAAAADRPPETIGTVRGDSLVVTLDKVMAAALAYNEMLSASAAMADAAAGEALGAWRGFLPRVQLGEYYLRSDDALNAFAFKLNHRIASPADFAPEPLNNPGTQDNHVTRLLLQQPLFNGGMEWNGKRAADAMARAAGFDHRRARETVALQAVQAYEGLVLARAYEQVVRGAVAAAEGHAAQAQAMVDAEMATEADLLQARVYLSGLRQRLIEVQNLAAVAGENIKLLTAVATDLTLAPAEGFVDPADRALPPFDAAAAEARADVRAGAERAAAAGRMAGVARGALFPHLNLSLERNWFGDRVLGDDARSWTLGFYATWDVFDGLESLGRLKKARAEARAAEAMRDFAARRARVEATQAWLDLKAAAEKVAVAREAVAAGRESLRIVTSQYREGLASMVDLLDTQAAATMAEGNHVQALHDYNVGLARLRHAGGAASAAEE